MATKLQELDLQASEVRATLADLAAAETPDEAKTKAALGQLKGLELRRSAAIAAGENAEEEGKVTETDESEGDAEGRELRELTDKAQVADIFGAAVDHGHTDGATKELQEHHGLSANQVPLSLFAEDRPRRAR